MAIFMLITYVVIIMYSVHKRKSWANTLLFTLAPYAVISFINNVIMVKRGYYEVSSEVIALIIIAIIPLHIGIWASKGLENSPNKALRENLVIDYEDIDSKVNESINGISMWMITCCLLRLIQIFTLYRRYGIAIIAQSDFSEFGLTGLPSHLFLTTYPLSGMVFYYGIKNKSIKHILLFCLGAGVAALSFIKYHAIIYVLFTFIYCIIKDRRQAKRLTLIFGGLVVAIFIGNYAMGFMIRGVTTYGTTDYLRKLWDYVGGSLINSNYSITEYGKEDYHWYDVVYSSLIPIINMFSTRIFNTPLEHKMLPLGFRRLNQFGTTSNVMSLVFVNLYTGSWVYFVFYLIIEGFVIESLMRQIRNRSNDNKLPFYIMVITINLVTFFANYYELPAIWEICIWSYIIPRMLLRSRRIKFKVGNRAL